MQKAAGNCRSAYDDRPVRQWVEWNLRLRRTAREMTAGASKPTAQDIELFYRQYREKFRGPVSDAAHIVKHVKRPAK